MTFSPLIYFLFVMSFAATCLIWKKIFSGDGTWYIKVFHAAFAAIPFLGPMLYVFLAPPPKHPPERQMPLFPKGTEVYPSFDPFIKSIGRMFGMRRDDEK